MIDANEDKGEVWSRTGNIMTTQHGSFGLRRHVAVPTHPRDMLNCRIYSRVVSFA